MTFISQWNIFDYQETNTCRLFKHKGLPTRLVPVAIHSLSSYSQIWLLELQRSLNSLDNLTKIVCNTPSLEMLTTFLPHCGNFQQTSGFTLDFYMFSTHYNILIIYLTSLLFGCSSFETLITSFPKEQVHCREFV